MRSPWRGFRSSLADPIRRFLAHKRAIGRRYDADEKNLRLLDRFLRRRVTDIEAITPEIVDAFLVSRARQATGHNHLLGTVRRFFAWLVLQGDLQKSPVRAVSRRTDEQRTPFLLEPTDARRLLEYAGKLHDTSTGPHRAEVYRTVFAIMSVLGLRVREVSKLSRADVDLGRDVLVIRETKFDKSRLVPFGPQMAKLLRRYLALRLPGGKAVEPDAPLFAFRAGRAIHPGTISHTFATLVRGLGVRARPGVSAPRAHGLRHAFAVRTLLRWYREGTDPAVRLFHLSTFLGHANPIHTAVYLTITDDLLDEASRRFERYGSRSWKR